jgi:hypothetical protein
VDFENRVVLQLCLGGTLSIVRGSAIVSRFIRKLPGGSQPILVEADDGELYVLKFWNNAQGPNLLFNESVGTELYHLAKLPVPRWRQLILTASFIDQNPSCYIETPDGTRKPEPVACFGSLFLGSMHSRIYELLPGSFYKRLTNIEDFWLAWLLDVCAQHADNRQALFPSGLGRSLYAAFIDHGHMFGGPAAEIRPRFAASRYLDSRVYSSIDIAQVRKLTKVAIRLDSEGVWSEARKLPQEWIEPSALSRLSECLNSLASPTIIEGILEKLVDLRDETGDTCKNSNSFERKPPMSILERGPEAAQLHGCRAG